VALIGDHDPDVTAHRASPRAIELASAAVGAPVVAQWIPTDEIADTARLEAFDGLWCVPASPYRSMDGALRAIRFAREQRRPFLGTCGGFQHAVLEYARNVLGWSDAGHAETDPDPDAARVVVAPLECSLVEVSGDVHLLPDTHLARAYGAPSAREGYHCRYGMNPAFRDELAHGPLRIAATDELGDVRAVELTDHPFFVATLFQPERAALEGRPPPIAVAFVRAMLASEFSDRSAAGVREEQ
jgi:CTP synthase (UTP-ammonia lyase)